MDSLRSATDLAALYRSQLLQYPVQNRDLYTILEHEVLKPQGLIKWEDCQRLLNSNLILMTSSHFVSEKTGLSISSGLLHLIQDLAFNGLLSRNYLSDFVVETPANKERRTALVFAEKKFYHIICNQSVYEEIRTGGFEAQICKALTEDDKAQICRTFEKALRSYILNCAIDKGECSEDWQERLASSTRVIKLAQQINHTPEDASRHFQLGQVALKKPNILETFELKAYNGSGTPIANIVDAVEQLIGDICKGILDKVKTDK